VRLGKTVCVLLLGLAVSLVPAGAKHRTRTLTMRATAYAKHGRTSSGTITHRGIIAADRRVLPPGSKVKVKGAGRYSGTYRVRDTGRDIRGRRIDIYIPSRRAAKRFGRRKVRVKVLKRASRVTGKRRPRRR
jgi:3D (Asp-Asp-Asp) domain-containing protein